LRASGSAQGAGAPSVPMLAYAGCLGIAYLAVEIPLIQRSVLLLDHPTIAFALVVSVVLFSSGLGSLFSSRLGAGWCFPLLLVYLIALVTLWSPVSNWALGHSLPVRAVLVSGLLIPLGVLMGMPFPIGVALLGRHASYLVPWAWGINGATSVVASILTAMVALDRGFACVLASGAILYLVAWLLLTRAVRESIV
jgi:predicted membrane-bound spermidine synthase